MRDFSKIGVAIVESLENSERKTGKELYETTLYYINLQKKFLENEYYDVSNVNDLFNTLNSIVHKALKENKFYFLHFEVHGNENGIVLKDGTHVDWSLILPYFRSLNTFYSNNLSIYLAVCYGGSMIRFINHLERAPFAFIFGSFKKIKNIDVLIMFEEFYTEFFNSFSTFDAYQTIRKLNMDKDFSIITAKYIIDYLLELERESKDKDLLLNAIDISLRPLGDISPNLNIIVENFRSDVIQIYNQYKVDENFFLMKDLQ